MSKDNIRKNSNKKKRYKDDNKYDAENEIIIGVTTKPKEKVRTANETVRTKTKTNKNKTSNENIKSNKMQNKSMGQANIKNQRIIKQKTKEKVIQKINSKKILLSMIVLFFLMSVGGIYLLTTPMFNVASIEVYGNNKNTVDTYISLSEINIGQTNIFAFTRGNIENKLKANPYVEKVEIKRVFPNVLELYITERTIEYQIENLNSYIYLNQQGYILEINEEKQDVPIIKGLSSVQNNIQVGKRLINEDLLKLDTILKIENYLEYNNTSESKLTTINAQDISNYILEFIEEDKVVYIGDSSSITEKMTAVVRILEAEKGKKGKIYANEDALKRNRIYFSEEK